MLKDRPYYLDKTKRNIDDLYALAKDLRSEDGCPWDKRQTHGSMKQCLLEEAAEALDGIDLLEEQHNPDSLREELGDLLFQVVLQSAIAEEEGYFTLDDVVEEISAKMIRRHPHVYGEYELDDEGNEVKEWAKVKEWEKARKSYTESPKRKKWRKKVVSFMGRLLSIKKHEKSL